MPKIFNVEENYIYISIQIFMFFKPLLVTKLLLLTLRLMQ